MTTPAPPNPDAVTALTERIGVLLRQVWGGRIRPMARDLGVPYTTLNRVAHGQPPGPELLLALAARADIDPVWLLTGAAVGPADRAGPHVPLVSGPLPVPPSQYPLLRADRTVSPLPDLAKPSIYAFQVPPKHPLTRVQAHKVAAGDIVFVDADPAVVLAAGIWNDRLVVWRWAEALPAPGQPARPIVTLGDLRRGTVGPVARVFGRRIEELPFDARQPHAVDPADCPPRPAPGEALGYRHVAGVYVSLIRAPTDNFGELTRL